jgi:hypothetical protein
LSSYILYLVIEVCPFGYCIEGTYEESRYLGGLSGEVDPSYFYFGHLAKSVDIVFSRWTASKANCRVKKPSHTGGGILTGNRKNCWDQYSPLPDNISEAAALCRPSKFCRACARTADVVVDTARLTATLARSMRRRQTCLAQHPLYHT